MLEGVPTADYCTYLSERSKKNGTNSVRMADADFFGADPDKIAY